MKKAGTHDQECRPMCWLQQPVEVALDVLFGTAIRSFNTVTQAQK